MIFLKLFAGILFFILGWIYFYKSNLVLTINRIAREAFFNDRIILLERKKLAILFFCLSFLALFMGTSSLSKWFEADKNNKLFIEPQKYLLYMAMQDYYKSNYENALEKYKQVLKYDPNNINAMKRMAYTYSACGEKKQAKALWIKLSRLLPDNKEILKQLEKK